MARPTSGRPRLPFFYALLLCISSLQSIVCALPSPDSDNAPPAPPAPSASSNDTTLSADDMEMLKRPGNKDQAIQPCQDMPFPLAICPYRMMDTMTGNFRRNVSYNIGSPDSLQDSITYPDDPSIKLLSKATFVVWDPVRGREVLGKDPKADFMFTIPNAGHEGPVYAPNTNELYFGNLQPNVLSQSVINLNDTPPTISQKTADPPIYAPAGARYRNGLIYFAAVGGNGTMDGRTYRPGIYTLDPVTGKSKTLLNNYYGYFFNTCDDLDIDSAGNIWFTDLQFGRNIGLNTEAPQLMAATYRYSPSSGMINIVDDSQVAPNGIAFAPDGKKLYTSDTGAGVANIDPRIPLAEVPPLGYNATGKRTVYAWDVIEDGMAIVNKRAIYLSYEFAPDGLKTASNGYVLTANGRGVDILDNFGTPLARVMTNFTAVNVAFAGPKMDQLWVVGHGGVMRLSLNLTGVPAV